MAATVVDLFSGGGGASSGFEAVGSFSVVGAADAQIGKPSSGAGTLACNDTYHANIGVKPVEVDLGRADPDELAALMGLLAPPDVLIACPPCTGFSRTTAANHIRDDERNALVPRVAEYVRAWRPEVVVMENARELVMGRFRHHLEQLDSRLRELGYLVHAGVHLLSDYGLPQRRERALVIAVAPGLPLRTMEDIWQGARVQAEATHVRGAIGWLPPLDNGARDPRDPAHAAPGLGTGTALARTEAIPRDGGSWRDVQDHPECERLLTPSMKDRIAKGDFGSHPDVYGRMWWDRPAPTIKRECGHVGNGRYTHPEQDRLCSVREMGILNGFPRDYAFDSRLSQAYRHIGDAVPPLIAFQLARLTEWILGGSRPVHRDLLMPATHLSESDIEDAGA